ncbi:alpha/beta fold hydrolase [Subtercola frigoramans]|uniref:Acyl-coenzyme A synthetase/AMP-(Fatty) acid ligase/pimeloyl-ACP methyl ester carboxylesterase n=1 Tax=Subtercola frigoramans TaxID=120298 RepID=A0ABS2L4F6_9MICO|nr:alpha/beta fold hydrolase [Subtercola frigoramans]MBM7471975.1 acyl-coenzyme A synthetase/AMP-(fatty) acid ligase/pimeloyl-ACP methyl ester carboxylesterase [Subtercola frigoramans]
MIPASLPPRGLPGLAEEWSRLVSAPDSLGGTRTWHILDNGAELEAAGLTPTGTILCVHGNPTWSYLWRTVLQEATERARSGGSASEGDAEVWRVIAVDQLEMGYSERSGQSRALKTRVADLGLLTETLELQTPVVTLGHDWGGVVSLGWAVDHPELLASVMLLNTAIHQPEDSPLPAVLRLVLQRSLLVTSTVRTTGFLDTTLAIAHPALAGDVRAAFRAPYRTAARRAGIGAFVADIPVDDAHDSFAELARISTAVAKLTVPALMLWGPRDPVFGDRYLADLITRLPHADVTRFERAGHLVGEDVAVAPIMMTWLAENRATPDDRAHVGTQNAGPAAEPAATPWRPLWATLDEFAADSTRAAGTALVEMAPRGSRGQRVVTWGLLGRRVSEISEGLRQIGVKKGDRVSLLVPPGADLTAVVYACLRIGAIIVVADAGLGVAGLGRAVRGAHPTHIIGIQRALTAARALSWPGQKISTGQLSRPLAAALGVSHSLADIARIGRDATPHRAGPLARSEEPVDAADTAAILFTSGSTGPAKGVVYTHGQLSALISVLSRQFGMGAGTGLVAGFAPFALLGPALGAVSVTPDMDVTAPRTLTARAVAQAAIAVDATVVFASPAALVNVVATASELTLPERRALGSVSTVLSAGAPLAVPLLEQVQKLVPEAIIHTPYGMTEGLVMTDVTLAEIVRSAPDGGAAGGVCVGRPVAGVSIRISALDALGEATGELVDTPGVTGEIVVAATHLKDHYDQLWMTERESRRDRDPAAQAAQGLAGPRWHRTADVGHFDANGRLWVEGRLPHVISTAAGVITPVGPEQAIEKIPGVKRAAAVGVGPSGAQQLVVVLELDRAKRLRAGVTLASATLSAAVRAAVRESTTLIGESGVAAVLVVNDLPTDVRHNSKIDRTALAAWAGAILAGGRRRTP